jgi:DNA-binding CsgD family transcriptional regulator
MGKYRDQSSQTQSSGHSESSRVVGSFCINSHQYLVIHYEYRFGDFTRPDLTSPPQISSMPEVGQFKVDGQHCVIVEAGEFSSAHSDMISLLTARELQIVKIVALGYSNKQIASQLHISEWTVSTHLRRIFSKLGVDSRAAMVYRCTTLINKPWFASAPNEARL